MPTDLLEKPPAVEGDFREVSKSERIIQRVGVEINEQKDGGRKPPKAPWRRIFEGHEEFLGWTPD